jgi:hypothetical protein
MLYKADVDARIVHRGGHGVAEQVATASAATLDWQIISVTSAECPY